MNSESSQPHFAKIAAAFAVIYIVWGSTYLAIRFAVDTLPPFFMVGLRFTIAGGLMYAYFRLTGTRKLTDREWIATSYAGILMLLGGNGLVSWAEQFVPSGITALIVGTAPLWIVGFEWVFFGGKRPSIVVVIGLILGLIGVAILADPREASSESVSIAAAGVLLLACVFWAWGSFVSKSRSMPESALVSVSAQMLAGGIAALLVSILLGEPRNFDPAKVSFESWAALAYLIVLGSILAFTCYSWLFRVCKPAHVATYAYVNPIVAVYLGWLLGDEKIGPSTILAAALILGGVFLVSITRKPKRPSDVAGEQRELAAVE